MPVSMWPTPAPAALENVAFRHAALERRRTTASPASSSAITRVERGVEFGACTRKRASGLVRGDSLATWFAYTEAGATVGFAISASRAPSLNGMSGGSTMAAERTR